MPDYHRIHRIIVATLAALGILAALAIGTIAVRFVKPANAETAPTFRSPCWDCDEGWRHRHRADWLSRDARRARKVWRDDWRDHEGTCKPRLAIVGDQYATEKGAREEADKAWMQTARWQHGERFMSRENADDAAYECGRSSVGSLAGQVFYRCRLSARPCAANSVRGN